MKGRPNTLLTRSLPGLLEHDRALGDLRATRQQIEYVDATLLRPSPDQARLSFEGHAELVASVLKDGVRTPIIARRIEADGSALEIVAGERRWRAALEASKQNPERRFVPVQLRDLTDDEAFLIGGRDNLERENLNSFERARLIMALLTRRSGLPEEDLKVSLRRAARVPAGRTDEDALRTLFVDAMEELRLTLSLQSFVRFNLPLLSLPHDLRTALEAGVAYKAVLKLRSVKDEQERQALLTEIQRGELVYDQLVKRLPVRRPQRAGSLEGRLQALSGRRMQSRLGGLDAERRAQVEALTSQLEALLAGKTP